MGQCDALLNGEVVGTVHWDDETGHTKLSCTLPDGWIYRAVLFCGQNEVARFGVLIPESNQFCGILRLPSELCSNSLLHCEVLRARAGEATIPGIGVGFGQFETWMDSNLPLDESVLSIVKKKSAVLFRIYNKRQYFLILMELEKADPLLPFYCIGKAFEIQKQWYLYVKTDENGQTIPWTKDEN